MPGYGLLLVRGVILGNLRGVSRGGKGRISRGWRDLGVGGVGVEGVFGCSERDVGVEGIPEQLIGRGLVNGLVIPCSDVGHLNTIGRFRVRIY